MLKHVRSMIRFTGMGVPQGKIHLVHLSIAACVLLYPGRVGAQIGSTLESIEGKFGRPGYAKPLKPATDTFRFTHSAGVHVEFGFVDQVARYALLRFSGSARYRHARIPGLVDSVLPAELDKRQKAGWSVDRGQTRHFPPVGRVIARSRFVPQKFDWRRMRSRGAEITKYYRVHANGYREFLNASLTDSWNTLQIVPVVRGTRRHYLAGRGAARFVMSNRRAGYSAEVELSFDSDGERASVNELLIADTESFWKWRIHNIIRLLDDPPSPITWSGRSASVVPYDEAVASLFSPAQLSNLYRQQLLDFIILGVDRGDLNPATVTALSSQLNRARLVRVALYKFRRHRPEIRLRRVELLGAIGGSPSVKALISLLKDREVREDSASALRKLASRFPEKEIVELGSDHDRWIRWWNRVRREEGV